jgi:hypothetical protein
MRLQEQEVWTTFQDGLWRLPEFDWDNNSLPSPTSANPLKTVRRRAEALNRLYETDRAHEGHFVWITKNNIGSYILYKPWLALSGKEGTLLVGVADGRQLSLQTYSRSIKSSLSLGRYVKKAMCFGQKLLITSAR